MNNFIYQQKQNKENQDLSKNNYKIAKHYLILKNIMKNHYQLIFLLTVNYSLLLEKEIQISNLILEEISYDQNKLKIY